MKEKAAKTSLDRPPMQFCEGLTRALLKAYMQIYNLFSVNHSPHKFSINHSQSNPICS